MTHLSKGLFSATLAAVFITGAAFAQSNTHSGHGNMDMSHGDMMTARSQHMVEAVGTVTAVNLNQRVVTISHGPIPAINWPAMTMKFPVGAQINLSSFGAGQKVQFTLHRAADGTLPLVELCAATNSSPLAGLCAPEMGHKPHTAQPAHKDDHAH